jgi:hypothetical protein
MNPKPQTPEPSAKNDDATRQTCRSIDWYAEGESRIVETDGVRVEIRYVGRRGRRGRIAIRAPAGAVFRHLDR